MPFGSQSQDQSVNRCALFKKLDTWNPADARLHFRVLRISFADAIAGRLPARMAALARALTLLACVAALAGAQLAPCGLRASVGNPPMEVTYDLQPLQGRPLYNKTHKGKPLHLL